MNPSLNGYRGYECFWVIRQGANDMKGKSGQRPPIKLNGHALLHDCVTLLDEPILKQLPWL